MYHKSSVMPISGPEWCGTLIVFYFLGPINRPFILNKLFVVMERYILMLIKYCFMDHDRTDASLC
jgi:hypothetical protein